MGLLGKIVAAVLALVLVLVGVVWYYGSPPVAEATKDQGWQSTRSERSFGIATVTTITYDAPAPVGGAIVATAPDLPVLDESRYTEEIVRSVAEKRGIRLERTGVQPLKITQLNLTERATYYDAHTDKGTGRAVVVDYPCPKGQGFIISVGWGLKGGTFTAPTFSQAVDLVKSVSCGG